MSAETREIQDAAEDHGQQETEEENQEAAPVVREVAKEEAKAEDGSESKKNDDEEAGKTVVDKLPPKPDKKDEKTGGDDDSSSEHSSRDSITTDESSFHASDYENDAGFDPEVDLAEMLAKATSFKEEGNEHFKKADMVRASRAYKKGVSLLKPIHDDEEKRGDGEDRDAVKTLLCVLLTNLSMCCLKNDKPKLSLDVAKKAVEVDGASVKAYYRRAMAYKKMGDLKEARKDLKKAVDIDPKNNTIKKELHALVKYMTETSKRQKKAAQAFFSFENKSMSLYDDKEEELRKKKEEEERKKKEKEEALKQRKQQWEDDNVKRMAANQKALSYEEWDKAKKKEEKKARKAKRAEEDKKKREAEEKRKAARKASREAEKKDEDSDDENLTEKELAMLRGYKKTSDGRTTSYFTREQSVKEKQLIGDITPQRLDASGDAVSNGPAKLSASATDKNTTGSAWNRAGTWEEKNTTDWCSSQLKKRLEEAVSTEGPCLSVVKEVPEFSGDASVATAGGKKRYIFDFHCKLDFDIRHTDTDEVLASGSFQLPDINSGSHEELEIQTYAWKKAPSEEYADAVGSCRLALIDSIRGNVKLFVQDFNSHF